jgi:membrane-associated phospholipid phosphatase
LIKKWKISYNPYFLFPFLLWVIAGGILLLSFSKQELFAAINTHHTDVTDTLLSNITYMGQAEVIVPILLLLLAIPRYRNWWYFITAVLCNVLPLLVQQALKYWYNSPRPMKYFNKATWIHISSDWPVLLHMSFPSGHSQGALSFFCFLSLLLVPELKKFGFLFFMMAMSVCYSRIYLAAHFFLDVYVGSIIGTITTIIVYTIMDKYKAAFFKKDTFIS